MSAALNYFLKNNLMLLEFPTSIQITSLFHLCSPYPSVSFFFLIIKIKPRFVVDILVIVYAPEHSYAYFLHGFLLQSIF